MNNREIREHRMDVLSDTIKFYKFSTRCVENGRCVYWKKNHQGCALGRLVPNEEDRKKLTNGFSAISILRTPENKYLIPAEIAELGVTFLTLIQKLHDTAHFWAEDDSGLTEKGQGFVAAIEAYIYIDYMEKE